MKCFGAGEPHPASKFELACLMNVVLVIRHDLATDIAKSLLRFGQFFSLIVKLVSRARLYDPMDCSPPGSSAWDSPGKKTGVGCHALLQGIFPTQGSNPALQHCRQSL